MSEPIPSLSHLALVAVEGQNAETFLQGQLTCDLREVTPQQSRLAAYCTAKGRIIATCRVFKFQGGYFLLLPAQQSQNAISQLQKFAVFSKVTLKVINETWSCLGYSGPLTMPETVDQVSDDDHYLICKVHGDARFLILGNSASIFEISKNLPLNGTFVDENTWRLSDIKAGIANIYPKTSELFTPNMLGLAELHGLSFDKGCYVGQEIIARTHYLGKVKRTLQRFMLEDAAQIPQPGDSVFNSENQSIGTIVDACLSGSNCCELLAVVQDIDRDESVYWDGRKLHR